MRPSGGETVSTLIPTLRWNAVGAADRFQIEIYFGGDTDKPEPRPVLRKTVTAQKPEFPLGAPLEAGREYAWRIRPLIEDAPPGRWSEYHRFRTPPK